MQFTPTTAQLELLAELEMARMPVAFIADRLGIDVATFKAGPRVWKPQAAILSKRRKPPPEILAKLYPHRVQRSQKKEPRIVADQIFDDHGLILSPLRMAPDHQSDARTAPGALPTAAANCAPLTALDPPQAAS
jgi:hypothetical protein